MSPAKDPGVELWQAVRDIYRTTLKRLNARLEREQITFPQYNVLLEISRSGPLPMSRLGDQMLVAPANVTGLIDRMELKGYVRRVRDSDDRRLWLIEMTPRGRRIFRGISKRFRRFTEGLGSGLAADELASALSAMKKVRERAEGISDL